MVPSPEHTILHVDMDAFYASIELLDHPELKGQPLVIGSPPDQRGVVSTASYEARNFGIHSAMPSRTAGKLCPHAVFLPVRMARYAEVSAQVMEVLGSFTPVLEQLSVDEAFLDVRGALRKWGDAVSLARALKATMRERLGLTASVGVATNKFLAKLASDLEKPDGLTVVPADQEGVRQFLAPLPVSRLWGVGKKTGARLLENGLRTVGDLQQLGETRLAACVGANLAAHLHALALGRDERPVVTEHEAKSLSAEYTFLKDCDDADDLRRVLIELVEKVGRRLRKAGHKTRTAQFKFRYRDFSTFTRRRALAAATSSDRALLAAALELFDEQAFTQPIRLLGFSAAELTGEAAQGLLPGLDEDERGEQLDRAVDQVRDAFGRDALTRGGAQRPERRTPNTER